MKKKLFSILLSIVMALSICLLPGCAVIDKILDNVQSFKPNQDDSSSNSNPDEESSSNEEISSSTEKENSSIPTCITHTFNENTLCTTCGYQEFVESDEYLSKTIVAEHHEVDLWMSVDGSYGLYIMTTEEGPFIYGYKGTPIHVVIPSSLRGRAITSVGGGYGYGSFAPGFYECQTLKSLIIPEGIKTVDGGALASCPSLKTISLPNTLRVISVYAFKDAGVFTHLILPKTLEVIGFEAFAGCTSLSAVYYMGTPEDWSKIFFHHENGLEDKTIYYYSEIEPLTEGNYWHYVDGKPAEWKNY